MVAKKDIVNNIHEDLNAIKCKVRIVSGTHIDEIHNEVQERRNNGSLDPDFYEEYKEFFESKPEADFGKIHSIFVIAHPHPATEVIFNSDTVPLPLLIPPTYLDGSEIIDKLEELLSKMLELGGYHIAFARIPVKTLAVHSGLAEYGKNNITYVPGMGSFHRLSAYYSDLQIPQDFWTELRAMELCKNCSACVNNCPTQAIQTDRFLLRAEKCITYHNEQPPEIPFPEWIDPSWHNCLIGCLICQKVCPADKKFLKWVEKGPEFTSEETYLLLTSVELDNLPLKTKEKIKSIGLDEYYEYISRNLGVFLQSK
ncbi:MAG: 4Fe-4S double cluster binding domain-containing protein [Promethearchaeota archaeon]|jgi:epoxyqueuosine reductase